MGACLMDDRVLRVYLTAGQSGCLADRGIVVVNIADSDVSDKFVQLVTLEQSISKSADEDLMLLVI